MSKQQRADRQPSARKTPCRDCKIDLRGAMDGRWQFCAACGEWVVRDGKPVRPEDHQR